VREAIQNCMANKFYAPGEERAAKVNDLFATVASRYDLMNNLQSFGLHRWWKRKLVQLATVRPGERALDVCCGTGDLSFGLARQGARVVGLDFTRPMLAMAESRQKRESEVRRRRNLSRPGEETPAPQFICGDAQQIPFPEDSFEIVTSGYGLRNLASWEAGVSEMRRVAKPGGRLLVLEFGKPDNVIWRKIYFGYLRIFSPLLGLIVCGSAAAYSYILESLKHYPAQRGVAAGMRALGLENVRIINYLGGIMSVNYAEKPSSK
jgi:demethylmenaquinone methyltransferase / 2-methoxy-6-polyprenyl-1,4-benzoquinol methylase